MRKGDLLFVLYFFYSLSAMGQAAYIVNGTPDWKDGVSIEDHASFFTDKNVVALPLQEVQKQQFQPFSQKRNERATESDVTAIRTWARFTISNVSLTDTAKLYLLPGAHGKVLLYQSDQVIARTGMRFLNPGAVPNPLFMPFSVPPGATFTYYMQVVDYVMSITPVFVILNTRDGAILQTAQTYLYERLLFLLMSVFVGCLLFMTIYSLYHFWLTRDAAFAWYFGYVALAASVALIGLEDRFEFPLLSHWLNVAPEGSERRTLDFVFLVPVFYTIFVSKISGITTQMPRIWLILKIFVVILLSQQMLSWYQSITLDYFYYNTYYQFQLVTFVLSTLLLLFAVIKGTSPVKYYLIAGLCSFIFLVPAPLLINYFNDSDMDRQTEAIVNLPMSWTFLGFTVEALCFAFALAYRNRLVEMEKNTMQLNYATRLESELATRTLEVRAQSSALEEQRVQQLQSDFDQKLAETEMTALRAQMNPHFIFNCLNSIKLYTLKNDPVTAANYLTKFSRLIRLVLENSRNEKVILADELEILDIYLQMEAMRFKTKVQYKINVSENVDKEYVEIPPLLLQPYVENAIWHGLMHKKGGGSVEIDVDLIGEQTLRVSIADDGVGRGGASEMKSKSATRDKSFGMKMTSERIGLINQLYKSNTEVKIEDLVDTEGKAAGTRVIIEIPV